MTQNFSCVSLVISVDKTRSLIIFWALRWPHQLTGLTPKETCANRGVIHLGQACIVDHNGKDMQPLPERGLTQWSNIHGLDGQETKSGLKMVHLINTHRTGVATVIFEFVESEVSRWVSCFTYERHDDKLWLNYRTKTPRRHWKVEMVKKTWTTVPQLIDTNGNVIVW